MIYDYRPIIGTLHSNGSVVLYIYGLYKFKINCGRTFRKARKDPGTRGDWVLIGYYFKSKFLSGFLNLNWS